MSMARAAAAGRGSISSSPPSPETALTPQERPKIGLDDPALYIYTSGTTGLPKAARITHSRLLRVMLGFAAAVGARPSDRVYMCLPMYHTNGGVIALALALTVGGSAYIREKFSASAFWTDCVREKCTLFVYIGELCRYLMNAPERPEERKHQRARLRRQRPAAGHFHGVPQALSHPAPCWSSTAPPKAMR